MQYLTLEEIKRQCNIDLDWNGDDAYLEMIGDSSEDLAAQILCCSLDEIEAEYGELPASIRHALRMLVDYFYSVNRGSADESKEIPEAVYVILKLFRTYM